MSEQSQVPREPPGIDLGNLQARKLLEARLHALDAQLRNFASLRDRMVATGKDANAVYREMLARRDKLALELRKLQPKPGAPDATAGSSARTGESLFARPIAPASFLPGNGIFSLGSSGLVQVAPAQEALNTVIEGKYPASGRIVTDPGTYPGIVAFSGVLSVGPEETNDPFDPSVDYFWLHSWKYLVPFPPSTTLSRLTYRFDVDVYLNLLNQANGIIMAFVSLGESANLTTGNDVVVTIDGGSPVFADLRTPSELYNGNYGTIFGRATVQRSLMVGTNHVPGIAIVVGCIVGTAMNSEISLYFPSLGDCSITLADAQGPVGRIAYSYEPQLVAHP